MIVLHGCSGWSFCMVGLHGCSAWRPAWRPPQRRVPRHRDQGLVQERTHVVHLHIQGHPAQRHALEAPAPAWKDARAPLLEEHQRRRVIHLARVHSCVMLRACMRALSSFRRFPGAFSHPCRMHATPCCRPCRTRIPAPCRDRSTTKQTLSNTHYTSCRDRSTTKQTQVRVPTRPRLRAAQELTHDRAHGVTVTMRIRWYGVIAC